MTSVAAELEHMEIQQKYNEGVNNRWDADEWDNENSSARLFERSRIKALSGRREGWMDERMDGGMNSWMDEQLDGWTDEWMNRSKCRTIHQIQIEIAN